MSEKQLEKLYYDPKQPGSYSGYYGFRKTLKDEKIKNKKLKEWLMVQETYTLHRPLRKKFKRNRIVVYGKDNTWQADLIDLQDLASINSDYKYLLSVIDVFSKYAWVVPLKNKTNKNVIEALKKIFKNRKPERLHTDQGQEFLGKVSKIFKKRKG